MGTVPTVPVFGTNAVVPSSKLAQLAAAVIFFLNPPRARLKQTSAQSIASGGSGTALLFDAEDIDTENGHSTSSNTSRWVCQNTGRYQLSGGCSFATSGTNRRGCWWAVNGTPVNGSEAMVQATAAGTTALAARTELVYLVAGDYVELWVYQDSGGALNTTVSIYEQASMDILWIASS